MVCSVGRFAGGVKGGIRAAAKLRLYEALIQEAEDRNTVCVKSTDGTETAYKVIF
jgi:hypothetical protein